jgi:NAD(P)H-nitrite reductase large subunit
MPHYTYLIVGGGMAAKAAVTELRDADPNRSIGMITAESELPYDRPPLSKALWTGSKQLDDIFLKMPPEVDFLRGRRVKQLDPGAKQVLDDQGSAYTYDRLLLATGTTPRRLPFGDERIIYFRTAKDYRRLKELSDGQPHRQSRSAGSHNRNTYAEFPNSPGVPSTRFNPLSAATWAESSQNSPFSLAGLRLKTSCQPAGSLRKT